MSDKFFFTKQLMDKASMNLAKFASMFRSSMMNKPKMFDDFMGERFMNDMVALPEGPTIL